jgi:hypothetical protein
VPRPDAVLAHQTLDAWQADPVATPTQLGVNAPGAVGLPDLLVDRADQHQGLPVGESLALRGTARLPGPKTALAHRQGVAQDGQREGAALRVDPGIFHSSSFAKYAAAFL